MAKTPNKRQRPKVANSHFASPPPADCCHCDFSARHQRRRGDYLENFHLVLVVSAWTGRPLCLFGQPSWHDYVEQNILSQLGDRAIVLNWSKRKRWQLSLAKIAFYHFGTYRLFNPLGVVFQPLGPTHIFRFWKPFRDLKHGHPEALRKMENDFFGVIGVQRRTS